MPIVVYFTFLIPGVQNSISKLITSQLSEDFGVEVTIKGAHFSPIKKLTINDLLIKDQKNDTLIFVNQLDATIDSLIFTKRQIYFGKITASNASSKILKENNNYNFKFIIDSLKNKSPDKSGWYYHTKEIKLKNCNLNYKNADKYKKAQKGFNPNNINISQLNLNINKIKFLKDSISANINNLSFSEQSGIALTKTKGILAFGKNSIGIKALRAKSKHSYLSLEYFNIITDSTSRNDKDYTQIPFSVKINSLSLNYNDLALIFPNFPKIKYPFNMKGILKGTIDNINGSNIFINAGTNTQLHTNFDIKGLPNLSESFVFLNVRKLSTNITDLTQLIPLIRNSEEVSFPSSFDNLGNIEYSGNFSGFIDNLVAYGEFSTDLGKLKTDLGIKVTEDNSIVYSGFLNTTSLNIGKLIKSDEDLNNVTMDISIQGYRTIDKHFNAYINGTIDSIDYKNYNYEKIELNGLLSNNRFNGKISLNDPNAKVEFNGKMDFGNEVPEFDFNASVHDLRLDKLKIAPKLKNSAINADVHSFLYGNSLNNIKGDIRLYNGTIETENSSFKLDSFIIRSFDYDTNLKEITINSNILDADLKGEYQLKSLPKQFEYLLSNYLPSVFSGNKVHNITPCDIEFSLKTKQLQDLLQTINPDIIIADNSDIKGHFSNSGNNLEVIGSSDELKINSIHGNNIDFYLKSDSFKITSNFRSESLFFSHLLPLYNFTLNQQSQNDTLSTNIFWNNWEEQTNSGAIFTNSTFNKSVDGGIYASTDLLPSAIIINDSTWKIQSSSFYINPKGFKINTFRTHHLNQEISINGYMYKTGSNQLSTYFRNIDLSELTSFLNLNNLSIGGMLNGELEIKENLESPIISSDLIINQLSVNNEEVGKLNINSSWDKNKNAVILETDAQRGNIHPIKGGGYFSPKSKDYSFDFVVDSVPLGFLNLYISKIAQNLKGTASGNIRLRKGLDRPELDGNFKVNKTKFNIDLLKCTYFIEDSIRLTSDSLVFKNMTVTDSYGKKGSFTGEILHNNFYDMSYNLYARANNMLVLNTSVEDNPYYYGNVYASGDLAVTGKTYDLNIDIQGKSEPKTTLFIPISDKEESLENNFIQFTNHTDSTVFSESPLPLDDEYNVNLSNFAMNMGIEITPDAQIQVIFDPSVGDILRSTGNGYLQIQISKEGDINFYGDYTAEKGDYLFSLENVVNKRFDINKGGTVVWQGDPYDAAIDITATYKIKTSIQPLVAPSSQEIVENSEIYKRIPINCDLILGDRLSQPSVQFDISAPTMEEATQNTIDDAINTEEELNRQVLSLLILNKFFTPSYNAGSGNTNQVNTAALTTTSEMLSSYLSNWLSQISNDLDIGINYRPEDEISTDQIEVALSTQLFNNRVSLNGNVEYGGYSAVQQNTSNIVGDFDMDVKLNKSGSLRAKAYTHSNDDLSYDNSPTTQGVGLSYQEEFDTFGELIKKYWDWITGKAKKEKEIQIETEETELNN